MPVLVAVEAEPAEEARLIERLCDWCSRYTPLAALDGRDGLMLDISGVAHLFGGEAVLVDDCLKRLVAQGITGLAGVAGNPRGSWALARFSRQKIAPEDLSDKAFAKLFHDLPLAALGLDDKTVADMARAGLRRIGDIALRPRAPITARFGPMPMAGLDALKGLERASIAPRFAAPDFCAEQRFASPVQTLEAIEATLRRLADDLVVLLERQAKGARRIELSLYRVDGAVRRIRVGASRPLNEARAIARLFAERLASPHEDAIDAGFGVDLMRLSCLAAEPLAPSQVELDRAHEAARARALADLIDRLSARLGARAVTRRTLIEAHLPEQAEAAAPATLGEARTRTLLSHSPSKTGVVTPFAGEGGRRSRPDEGERGAPARPLGSRPSRADRGGRRSARRAAVALPLAARPARRRGDRGPRTHRRPMVAARRRADARLFPRRGFARPPLLALPRRPLGPRDAESQMVRARDFRVKGAPFAPQSPSRRASFDALCGEKVADVAGRMRACRGDRYA